MKTNQNFYNQCPNLNNQNNSCNKLCSTNTFNQINSNKNNNNFWNKNFYLDTEYFNEIPNLPGPQGPQGQQGPRGFTGLPGIQGPQGIQGETGPAGVIANFADFYAIMPPDNAATVAAGENIAFPQDGPNSAGSITRTGPDAFSLIDVGTYLIMFQVSVTEAGQLVLTLNDEELPYTVVGRATGTDQIVGTAIITTTVATSILTVRNPASEAAALTITPNAGGTEAVSAHLTIIQLQ